MTERRWGLGWWRAEVVSGGGFDGGGVWRLGTGGDVAAVGFGLMAGGGGVGGRV